MRKSVSGAGGGSAHGSASGSASGFSGGPSGGSASGASLALDVRAADFVVSGSGQPPIKERIVAWARAVALRLRDVGVDVEATWSGEEPIVRHGRKIAAARVLFHAPMKKHAFLALRLDHRRIEISLEAYPSLHAREHVAELVAAFGALPEQFELGRLGDEQKDHRIPAYTAGEADLRAVLDDDGALWVGWSLPRDLALQHAAILGEQLADALVALVAAYRIVSGERLASPDSERRGGAVAGGARRALPKRVPLRRARADADVDARAPIEKGTRVQVLKGPFVGKTGIVQELDGRGRARVMLGLLAARLDVKDLIASVEGRGRPVLGSSHRRPLPTR